jgi:hypothetical protein
MSKTIAALTALRLSQDGRVSLDQDVARYLKRWPPPALPSGASKPVTLRRLFGMTAGCNVPGYFGYAAGAALPDHVQILQGASPANSPLVRIVQAPGSARAYSGRRLPDRSGRACDGAVLRCTGRRARGQAARHDSVRVLATAGSVGRRHAGGRT